MSLLQRVNGPLLKRRLGTKGADIASASTVNLATASGSSITVTHASGTTAITSLGTVESGRIFLLTFSISSGTLTTTHNATSNILPGAANITIANNDVAVVESLGSGNWRWRFTKADGTALSIANNALIFLGTYTFSGVTQVSLGTTVAAVANIQFDWTAYHEYLVDIVDIGRASVGTIQLRVSQNGGATDLSDASYVYCADGYNSGGAAATVNSAAAAQAVITGSMNNTTTRTLGEIHLQIVNPSNAGVWKSIKFNASYESSAGPSNEFVTGFMSYTGNTTANNGLFIISSAGNISGKIYVYGKRDS